MTVPDVLAFADRKTDGAFLVTEPSGGVVARIKVSFWSGASFEAVGDNGEPLCSGRHRSWVSSWWDAVDPAGQPLASLKSAFLGSRKQVTLPDERVLTLQGKWAGRDWSLGGEDGGAVLSSEPANSAWSFRPDAWIVRCHDASLSLAQVVGIVETNRLMVKAARSSSVAAST